MTSKETQWEVGGLSLHSQTPSPMLPVPAHLAIRGAWLHSRSLQPGDRLAPAAQDLILQFALIQTAGDVLTFASRFGVLRRHEKRDGLACREPLAFWFRLAKQARAILHIASALHQEVLTSIEDWKTIYEASDPQEWLTTGTVPPSDLARFMLSTVLNEWLESFDTRPHIDWLGDSPRITFGRTLPSILAMGLIVAVTRTEGLALCSACGRPYLRTGRQPKRGQQNYCAACRRDGAPARHAAARYRTRASRTTGRSTQRRAARRITARARSKRLLALTKTLGLPPRGRGAGVYWRTFHARAKAQGLIRGRTAVAAQIAWRRARQQNENLRSDRL